MSAYSALCQRGQWLRWHHAWVVNDYADENKQLCEIVFACSYWAKGRVFGQILWHCPFKYLFDKYAIENN